MARRADLAVGLLAGALFLSGCAEVGAPSAAGTASDAVGPGEATVAGFVVDEASLPIEGAEVGLLSGAANLTDTTDEDGAFRFAAVPAGAYQLVASKFGFESARRSLTMGADEAAEGVLLTLVPIPTPGERAVDTVVQDGFLSCAANIGFWNLVVNQVCRADPNHTPLAEFDVFRARGLVSVVLELDWVPTTAATGGEMRQSLWKNPRCSATNCDLDKAFGAAQGGPPLKQAFGSIEKPFVDDLNAEGATRLASFVYAPNHGDYTGTGVVFQQRFTMYASVFYNDAPSPDYTLVPAS